MLILFYMFHYVYKILVHHQWIHNIDIVELYKYFLHVRFVIKCLEITDFPWHEQSEGYKFTFQMKQPFAVSRSHLDQPAVKNTSSYLKFSIFPQSLHLQASSFYDIPPKLASLAWPVPIHSTIPREGNTYSRRPPGQLPRHLNWWKVTGSPGDVCMVFLHARITHRASLKNTSVLPGDCSWAWHTVNAFETL